jgi:hypothetical protein
MNDLRTFEDRFNAAVSDMRRQGVKFHRNIRQCCRGCVTAEQLGLSGDNDETTPYVWTYGGQGCAFRFAGNGEPEYSHRSAGRGTLTTIYLYHGNGGAAIAAAAFRAQGLNVEWDGTEFRAVEIIVRKEA